MCCIHVLYTCAVYMCCIHVLYTCAVYMCCIHVLCTCAVYMCCIMCCIMCYIYTASHEGTLVPTDVRTPKQSHATYVQDVYTS